MLMADPRKWKHFERLIAAIHAAANRGANVKWNDSINGRQFDVTIRFKQGLYEYLTVIECKDYARPVPVDKVEAFVTKSQDVGAHHGVLASSSGFQGGALDAAKKHNITLIHVTPSYDVDLSPFGARWNGETHALHIQSISFEYTDGETKRLPQEAHALTYYVNQIALDWGRERVSLANVIQRYSIQFINGRMEAYADRVISCPLACRVISPDDGEIPLKLLARIHVRAGMTNAKIVVGPTMFDPYLLTPDVKVINVLSGEEQTFTQYGLELGHNTVLEVGKFYENPTLAIYYYCKQIQGSIVSWYVVESYQLGQLLQAKFTQETKYAGYYVEVTDRDVLSRLQRRLNQLNELDK
jgi:hypothetical protein